MGLSNIITFDMGGTSTDVALVQGVEPRMSYDNQISAYPLQMPQLDIHTIGSGGGSVVWIGPTVPCKWARKVPGPFPGQLVMAEAAAPTLSDANLILGKIIRPTAFERGSTLDFALAQRAFLAIAKPLGVPEFTLSDRRVASRDRKDGRRRAGRFPFIAGLIHAILRS